MRTFVVLTLVAATFTLGACRREYAVEPMKLGSPTVETTQETQ